MSIVSGLVSAARSLIAAFAIVLVRVVGGSGAPLGARACRLAAGFVGVLAAVCSVLAAGASPALADSCPNAQFRYGYGAQLPDCRAYEQVTPVDKNGTNPQGVAAGVDEAASDGNAVTFFSDAGLGGGVGAQDFPIYESRRGADGWTTADLFPPADAAQRASVLGWSPDLSEVFDGETIVGQGTSFVARDSATGSFTTITPYRRGSSTYALAGVSADDSQVLFEECCEQLTPNAVAGVDNLYDWDRDSGSLTFVGVLPDGASAASGSFAGPYNWWGPSLTDGGAEDDSYAPNTISSDGSKVFFTAAADAGRDAGTDQIYVRENPTSSAASTVQVSATQKINGTGAGGADPAGPQPAAFMAATPDGAHVLFASPEELTNDATTGSADQGNDLYVYDAGTQKLNDISLPDPGITDTDPNGAEVQGVLGMSNDASYVYFAANGVLASGASPGTCNGSATNGFAGSGTCNLYLWHAGRVSFIAQLSLGGLASASDSVDLLPTADFNNKEPPRGSRVTPSGQTLLFTAYESLTGYDNAGHPELYLFQASSGQLSCVSCDPSGAPASAPATLTSITTEIASATSLPFMTRNLSDSGDQVFFESSDPLLPQATNGVNNVYEWEADGAGSCQSAGDAGGCLYLISTGRGTDPSYFLDASASGSDVFFYTSQPLVGQDQDQLVDIYDARVDGGLASQNPGSPPPPCFDPDSCRSDQLPPVSPPTALTITFSGPGNAVAASRAVVGHAKVIRHTLRGDMLSLLVKVPGAGRISASGADLRAVGRTVGHAGNYTLAVPLTRNAIETLKRKRKLKVKLRVGYRPASGRVASVDVAVSLRPAVTRGRTHAARRAATRNHGGER